MSLAPCSPRGARFSLPRRLRGSGSALAAAEGGAAVPKLRSCRWLGEPWETWESWDVDFCLRISTGEMSPSSTDSTINWGTSENGGFHLERWIDMNGDLICLRARFLECFGDHGQNQSPMTYRYVCLQIGIGIPILSNSCLQILGWFSWVKLGDGLMFSQFWRISAFFKPDLSRVVKSERRSPAASPKKIQKAIKNLLNFKTDVQLWHVLTVCFRLTYSVTAYDYIYNIRTHIFPRNSRIWLKNIRLSNRPWSPAKLYANVTMRMFLAAAAALPAIGCTR